MKFSMKAIVLATTLLASVAGAASAMTSSIGLSSADESRIMQLVPGADLSALTVDQIGQLNALFANSDNLRGGENPAGKVERILNRAS